MSHDVGAAGPATGQEQDLSHVRQMWADDQASAGLGMQLLNVSNDRARVRMTLTEVMVNGHDIAYGGFVFTLAGSAFALACNARGRPAADATQRTTYGRSGITDVTVTRESDGAVIAEFRGRSRSLVSKET